MSKLYTPRLLSLSAELAEFALAGPYHHTAEVRSRTCGSTLALGVDLDSAGRVERIGMQVAACAVGQSSAATMALGAKGRTSADFRAAHDAIEDWLGAEGALPDWPGFDALEAARAHPGRHGALLLPWKAMVQALSQSPRSG